MRTWSGVALTGMVMALCAAAAASAGEAEVAYVAHRWHPWVDGTTTIRLLDTNDGVIREMTIPPKEYKVGAEGGKAIVHDEWYSGGIEARAGRIAFTRDVMVDHVWNEKDEYSAEPTEFKQQFTGFQEIVVLDYEGRETGRYGREYGTECFSPRISPDGSKLVYCFATMDKDSRSECIRSRVCVVDLTTGETRDLTPDQENRWSWVPCWSPDGRYVACFTRARIDEETIEDAKLIAIPLDEDEPVRQLATIECPGGGLDWSADGKWIALGTDNKRVNRGMADADEMHACVLETATGKIRKLCKTRVNEYSMERYAFRADGRLLLTSLPKAQHEVRPYVCEWGRCLSLPDAVPYAISVDGASSMQALALHPGENWTTMPVLPATDAECRLWGDAPEYTFVPSKAADPRAAVGFAMTTEERPATGEVRIKAALENDSDVTSAWWEDVQGNLYPGLDALMPKTLYEQGVFLVVMDHEGETYKRFIHPSRGAPPEALLRKRKKTEAPPVLDGRIEFANDGKSLRLHLNAAVSLDLAAVPGGVSVGDGVHSRDHYIQTFKMQSVWYFNDPTDKRRMDEPIEKNVPGFYLGSYEVTQAQYEAVMGENPSTFRDPQRPVESIRFENVETFCSRVSEATGLTVRLPTIPEWRRAAGRDKGYAWGQDFDPKACNYAGYWAGATVTDKQDWDAHADAICKGMTLPVGSFAPNEFGLYDLHGNVEEFCLGEAWVRRVTRDREYKYERTLNESVPVMGGGWVKPADQLRIECPESALTGPYPADWRGFRILVEHAPPAPPAADGGEAF